MQFEDLVEDFFNKYIFDYGQIKFHDVAKKLLTSNSVKTFLEVTSSSRAPNYNEIVATVMNIPYFGFGKKTTIALGSIMLAQTWNEQINKKRNLLEDYEQCMLFDKTLKKCMGLL
jgi:hypothetical protein